MIKRYNNLSFLFFIPGVVAQIAGMVMLRDKVPGATFSNTEMLGLALAIVGTALAITGFAYYAKAKGRSPLFGLCGFLGIIGLLILAVLKDRSGDPWNT